MAKKHQGAFSGIGIVETEDLGKGGITLVLRFEDQNRNIEELHLDVHLTNAIVKLEAIVECLRAIHNKRFWDDPLSLNRAKGDPC